MDPVSCPGKACGHFQAISVYSGFFVFLRVFASSREEFLRPRVVENYGAAQAVNVYTGDGK
jgi:hypothetical protein